jgi:hypothetical protein
VVYSKKSKTIKRRKNAHSIDPETVLHVGQGHDGLKFRGFCLDLTDSRGMPGGICSSVIIKGSQKETLQGGQYDQSKIIAVR